MTSEKEQFESARTTPQTSFVEPGEAASDSLSLKEADAVVLLRNKLKEVVSAFIADRNGSVPQRVNSSLIDRMSDIDILRIGYCRSLDPESVATVFRKFLETITSYGMEYVSRDAIQRVLESGFCVVAGTDLEGRTMLWQRMKFMEPGSIPLHVGIKTTFLALDAGLNSLPEIRNGVVFVYDFSDIGLRNIYMNPLDVKNGIIACGLSHPSNIAKIVFIDAPTIFRAAFAGVSYLLPASVSNSVQFVSSSDEVALARICDATNLPKYLGGEADGDYFAWVTERLKGRNILYDM